MKRLGFLSILLLFMISCQKDYNKTKHSYQFIPPNAEAVIQINELNDFLNSITNNTILETVYSDNLKAVSPILKQFSTTAPVYLTYKDSTVTDYLILTKHDTTLFVIDSLPNLISETLANSKITKTQIDESVIYHTVIGNTFAGSNDLNLLKNLNAENENTALSQLIETTDTKAVASIVFKSAAVNYSELLFTPLIEGDHSNYTVLDFTPHNKGLSYHGILTAKDSIANFMDRFNFTIPQKINTPQIAPKATKSLLSLTYDDFSVFLKNNSSKEPNLNPETPTFLNFTNEIARTDEALILHSLDPKLLVESIEEKSHFETFRDLDIFNFENPDFFKTILNPFITFEEAKYFAVFENFVIFTAEPEALKSILVNALNRQTLSNSEAFINMQAQLSDEASLFIYKDSDALSSYLDASLKGYDANAVQFIHEDHYTHVHGIIQKFKKRSATNSVNEAFTTTLEHPLILAPQVVKNHITKTYDIVAQDANNILYLISNTGNILWKKQLQGQILGAIEQIDMYKNGRLQLAFTTPKRLYVLDRNGNDVSPFPLKFNDPITQPLSVFDYNKRKDYRLLVTQGKHLLMYNAKGQPIKGFKYKNNGAALKTQPQHYRIGTKDYIVFAAGKDLKILNRQGQNRINLKEGFQFSDNSIYLYQNKFTTTNTLGQLVQVNTRGTITRENLNLTDKHNLNTTSKTMVTLNENKLTIKSRTIDLDYGDYTAPRIFYLNDKIYITTTDKQAKKVYLFDSQGKTIPNFPVFGVGAATLEKLDDERDLELISQSDDQTIVVYKIN